MSVDPAFVEHLRDLFAGLGGLRAKPMFGGVGLYAGDLFFALVADDVLYLKADDATEPAFAAAGSQPFRAVSVVRGGRARPAALHAEAPDQPAYTLRYWRLPDAAMDDPQEAMVWARLALDGSRRKAAARKPPRAKPG